MTKTFNKYYPFQVWASTLIVGPILGILLNVLRRPDSFDFGYVFGGPFALALGGAFVSLPAFAIYYLIYRSLRLKMESDIYLKFILCPIVIAGLIATIYFLVSDVMLQSTNRDGFLLVSSYVFCAFVSTFSFKTYKQIPAHESKTFSFEEENIKRT
jgi:hypothetical protein